MTAPEKYEDLRKIVAGHGPMLVAYSGGVDSTLLAAVAREVLGEKTRCVLLDSPVVPGPRPGRHRRSPVNSGSGWISSRFR